MNPGEPRGQSNPEKGTEVNKKALSAVVAGLALIGFAAAIPASADPTSTPRALNGMGSDTTQDVMNGMAAISSGKIASWNATGTGTVNTGNVNTLCGAVTRANGSGAGRTALKNDTNGCLQFARSSSYSADAALTYIPFAVDGLTYGVTSNSDVTKDLSLADLQSIFRCGVDGIQPVLPQSSSGTRKDWLKYLGIDPSGGGSLSSLTTQEKACYPEVIGGSNTTEENDGRALKSNQVMPFSVAKWVSMSSGVISDVRGKVVLGILEHTSPISLNTDGANTRTVYNVIRRTDATAIRGTDPLTQTQTDLKAAFVGSGSTVCSNPATIIAYGFAPIPVAASAQCGALVD